MKLILRRICAAIFGVSKSRAYEKLQYQMRVLSRRVGDREYSRMMADFYTNRVLEIDPHADWWGFADAKQKQQDYQTEHMHMQRLVDEAEAKVEARRVQLEKLTSGSIG